MLPLLCLLGDLSEVVDNLDPEHGGTGLEKQRDRNKCLVLGRAWSGG